jgi:8-oxo-dGTP pyrophosphatase MutT (NUDIX family)
VMLLLRPAGVGLEILLGRRVRRSGDPWSGQVSFPGGHHHRADGSLLETALRETREEMNLDLRGRARILGHLAPRSPGNVPEMLVVPFVAFAEAPFDPRPGPEMTEAFWAPLADLPRSRNQTVVSTRIGELRVPAFLWRDRVIWGLTYRILEELLALLGLGP